VGSCQSGVVSERLRGPVGMAGSFLTASCVITSNSAFVDMIRRRSLRTRAIKMLVLDEADEMLNKGISIDLFS
jgi:hypothetical protein